MATWGVALSPGKVAPFVPPPEGGRLHLSQAVLVPPKEQQQQQDSQLHCLVFYRPRGEGSRGGSGGGEKDGGSSSSPELALAALRCGNASSSSCDNVPLDLIFDEYTEFRLEVRGAKGAPIDGVQVHLTGYHLPDFGGEEDGCGHDEEEDEEAEEEELSDEEDLALARLADGSRGALYDSESEDGMISDESSEDDSDDDSESYSESDGESETDDSEVSDSESESEEEDDEKVPSSVIIEELDANDDDKKEGSSSDSESDDESDDDSDDSDGSGDDEPDDEPVATAPAWGGGGEEKDGKDNKRKAAPSPSDAAEAAAAAESDAKKAKTAASAPTTPVPSAAAVDAKKQHQQQQIQQKQKEQQQQQQQQQKLKEQQQLAQKLKEAQQQASSERIRRFDNGFVIETLASSKSATAPLAKAGKRIKVRYVGKLAKNGKVFDQTKGNATFSFRLGVGEVIKGWDRGCEGMRVGDKRRLTVPPQMGYGSSGVRGTIPGNATLVFDVELVGVQ